MRLLHTFGGLALTCASVITASNCSSTPTSKWIDTWASMPQRVEPSNLPPTPFTTADSVFHNATLRQTLHVSVAASRIRVLIQNVFGATDLPITGASIALPTSGKAGVGSIDVATLKPLTFGGQASASIAAGGQMYTDPIDFPVANQSIVTISLYLENGQSGNSITGHPGSRTTSWFGAGDLVNAANVTDANVNHWYFVTAIEAWEPSDYATWVILGDSITDGRGTTDNGNNRWPDLVLARLQASSNTTLHKIGLANEAAGGNSILSGGLGPPLLTRYKRDAIAQPGVKWVTIFEGVNDIGSASTDNATQTRIGDGLIAAYEQIATDCHAAGLKVSGATITPFGGDGQAYSSSAREVTRLRVNEWIRNAAATGIFDALIDFAQIMGNSTTPSQLAAPYDGGDHLHPNVAGYQAMADAFPLAVFS